MGNGRVADAEVELVNDEETVDLEDEAVVTNDTAEGTEILVVEATEYEEDWALLTRRLEDLGVAEQGAGKDDNVG